MSEKTKETPINIDDKEYILEDMTEQCRTLVNHATDLDRKIASSQWNLDQLRFGRQAFITELKTQLET
jgi:hypothetical protein